MKSDDLWRKESWLLHPVFGGSDGAFSPRSNRAEMRERPVKSSRLRGFPSQSRAVRGCRGRDRNIRTWHDHSFGSTMTPALKSTGVGAGRSGIPTRECSIISLGTPARLNGPPGVRFNFARILLAGPGWVTTLDDFCVSVRIPDADSLAVVWSAQVESSVRAGLYDEGVADVMWFLCLYRGGIPLPLAYFSDSFPRRCGAHFEGRPVTYRRYNGNNGRCWEWQDDVSMQLQTCDRAAGRFVYALNVTECR
jgi:hypothetical protein